MVTSLLLGAVLAAGTIAGTTRMDNDHRVQALAQDQRVDLLSLAQSVAEVGIQTDTAAAADARVEAGELTDRIYERYVDLVVADPSFASRTVDVNGTSILVGDVLEDLREAVDSTISRFAAWVSGTGIELSLEHVYRDVDLLDGALAEVAAERGASMEATSATIRSAGLALAAAAVIVGAIRLLVLGRPMLAAVEAGEAEFRDTEQRHADEGFRRELTTRLTEGLETAESEDAVYQVVQRGMAQIVLDQPAELLLAPGGDDRLRPVVHNPGRPAPGCDVQSILSCPAVRRASTMQYKDSSSMRACPHLVGRGELSAVCVPVAFMGDAMGVFHVTGEIGWEPDPLRVEAMGILAGQAAVRLGSIRSFQKAETQASTDLLTGLPNRRATEEHINRSMVNHEGGCVALGDLDRFKRLNDTYGHEAGDRALKLFASVLQTSLREQDWAGRWGGEEFVIHLPGLAVADAAAVLDRLRADLAEACAKTTDPDFTVSLGVMDVTSAGTLDEILALADECLYYAKEHGRNQVVVGPVAVDGDPAADETTANELDESPEVVS